MTASERLRELAAERSPGWEGRWLDLDGKWVNIDTVLFITDRLPLIADVVEAAEWADVYSLPGAISEQPLTDLAAIQRRLAPALTALRDSLEKP